METTNARVLIGQLNEDLSWLEQHCRQQATLAEEAGRLRLAASLVRNCIGPFLDNQPAVPLHLVVCGGAGAGKSTVANMLSGASAAEANPQAGYTRHPIAYTSAAGPANWAGYAGFLGPLHRLTQPSPASLDEDVYQVRRIPPDPTAFDLLKDYVVWDCPDMTTWAATNYVPRLLEVSGLADVLVYVASDERYNDEVPTQFLRMLLETGKPVIACLMKMREDDAPALIAHFQKEVLSRMPRGVVAILAIPHLTPAQLADPAREAPKYRVPLVNQAAVLAMSPEATRKRTVKNAAHYLATHQEKLLQVARQDLDALEGWHSLVKTGQEDFENRYVREYLTSEKYRGFDEALVRLLQLLELPGVGKVLGGVLYVVRTPYRLLTGLLGKAMNRPDPGSRPELPVLEEALTAWVDLLRKEAGRRAETHPLWAHVAQGFNSGGLADRVRERFQQNFKKFQMGMVTEADNTARAIYEELEKKPATLNALRGSKLALDLAAGIGTVIAGGVGLHDLILVPIVVSLTHHLVELLGKQFVEVQREATRHRQRELLTQTLAAPLGEWLTQWPSTGGSPFERLQLALRRLPGNLQQLDALVQKRLNG